MTRFLGEGLGSGSGGGGGITFDTPPRIFTGANVAACRTARDTHFGNAGNAGELARYQGNQYLAIILRPTSGDQVTETYLPGNAGNAYDATQWIARGSSNVTDAHIDARIAPYARAAPTGVMALAQAPAGLQRTAALAGAVGGQFGALSQFDYDATTGAITLATGSVAANEIAFGSVGRRHIAADSVANGHLVANAVTGSKIASGAIIARHFSASSVMQSSVAANAIGTVELIDGSVTEAKLAQAVRDQLGGGGGSAAFVPSKSNIYDAVKAILVHNTAVTADDADDELDIATGGAASISDNSIAPIKAQAGTAAQQKAWRERLASSSIGLIANALPATNLHNTGDTLVIGRGGATVVPFREIDAPATELTATVAGDVMMLLAAGWTRIGNFFSGGIAAAAAQAAADAANTLIRKVALLTLYVDPGVVEQQAPANRVQAITGNYRLVITPPDILSGEDVWVRVFARGAPLTTGRVKVNVNPAPHFAIPFAINTINATNIVNNDPTGDSVDVEVLFYNADADTGLFETRTVAVDVVETPRVDDRQPLLPNLGNDQVWISRGSGAVAESIETIATPVIIVTNIASFDATQNRFEDSSGNEVTVPNGSIVTLTQAVYDAAVADAQFTPNPRAAFFTRS